jgi:pimeloyl-ACP methyl ester carboxylesterase
LQPDPARDPAEARARFDSLRGLDDGALFPVAYSRMYAHPSRTPLALVLLHGFTNCPAQFAELAEQLFARGHSLVVPRLPGHGDADRSGRRLDGVGAPAWCATTRTAIDIARGLGERVVVAGVSLGGVLAAWAAATHADVARAVAVAPFLGVINLGLGGNVVLERALALLPNASIPWDPFGDQSQIPPYAYPCFSSRGLGQSLHLGLRLLRDAAQTAPACRDVVLVTNSNDPAIDNRLVDALVTSWNRQRPGGARDYRFAYLPAIHDIVDPMNHLQRVDLVYPKLIELIEGGTA